MEENDSSSARSDKTATHSSPNLRPKGLINDVYILLKIFLLTQKHYLNELTTLHMYIPTRSARLQNSSNTLNSPQRFQPVKNVKVAMCGK